MSRGLSSMTWTRSRGQTKNMHDSLAVSGSTFAISLHSKTEKIHNTIFVASYLDHFHLMVYFSLLSDPPSQGFYRNLKDQT